MRAFIEHGENHWMQMRKEPAQIDKAFALLAQAEAKAASNAQVAKRIAIIADYIAPMRQLRDQLANQRKNVPHVQILTNDGKPITVDGKFDDDELWQRTGARSDSPRLRRADSRSGPPHSRRLGKRTAS